MSENLSPAAQRSQCIGFELVKRGLLPASSIESFTSENPLYRVVDQPIFNPRRAQNVLESIHPNRGIPQGLKDLEQIHCRCLAQPPHNKKHHH